MNIEKLSNLISFNKILKDFEFTKNIQKENILRDSSYYRGLIDFLLENHKLKFNEYFPNEFLFFDFLKENFLEIPFQYFYKDFFLNEKINKMIAVNFEYLHEDMNRLLKLMSFYTIPNEILKIYDEIFPQYFDEKYERFEEFMSTLFYTQNVPTHIFLKYLASIKKSQKISFNICVSKYFKYYHENVLEKDRVLYNYLLNVADPDK